MSPDTKKSTSSRRNSGSFLGARIALATGATLAMLMSAQLFVSADASSTSATTSTQTTAIAAVPTQSSDLILASDTTTSSSTTTSNTQQTTITTAQSQPSPSTHSSR